MSCKPSLSKSFSPSVHPASNVPAALLGGVAGDTVPPARDTLLVSFGESNSGGFAVNTDAASWEIGSRSELQMWNVTTEVFEALDIGTNNNLDHDALDSTTHGWELGLANRIKQGQLGSNDWYYVQTGQGGSTIAEWESAGTYWTKFLARVTAAKAAMPGEYNSAVWISLGINDAIAGTPISPAAYRSGMEEIITRIKAQLPSCKIFILTLPAVNSTYTGYSQQIEAIAAADSAVYSISATSPESLDMRDTNHWSYRGMKRVAARFVQKMQDVYRLAPKWMPWSARNDAGFLYYGASAQHAYAVDTLKFDTDGQYFAASYTASSSGLVLAVDDDISAVNWGGSDPYNGGAYSNGGLLYRTATSGTATSTAQSTPIWARFRKSGNNLELDTSTDGGTTWTNRHTFTGALTGKTTVRVKALSAVGAAELDVWSSESQSVDTPLIVVQPASTSTVEGLTATFSIDALFASSYQWQKQEGGAGDWANVSGATSSSYTTSTLTVAADNGDKYRCVVSGSLTSSEATLTVAAFAPSALSGCLAFFDASSGVFQEHNATTTPTTNGNVVGTWTSTVGSRKLTAAASDTTRPTLATNIVNSKPVVRFDGSNDKIAADAAMSAKTVFLVVKYRNPTTLADFPGVLTGNSNGDLRMSMTFAEATGGTLLSDSLFGSGTVVRKNATETTIDTGAPNDVTGPMDAFTYFLIKSDTAANFTWQLASDRATASRFAAIDVACLGFYQDNLDSDSVALLEEWAQDTFALA